MSDFVNVSVIVATYRRDKELKRALDSLANQFFDSFEIIVIDDNDNDEWNLSVEKILSDFKNDNPNLKIKCIENHPNLGSAKTRNIGINVASGRHITFLDDDDIYFPEKIKKQHRYMEENDLDYSVSDMDLYFDNEKFFEKKTRKYIEKLDKESLLKYHIMYHITGTDTMMFKKEYITKIGCFEPIDVGDEFYLMQKAIEKGGKFGYLNECDVKAYVHTGEGGLSSGKQKIDGENSLYKFKKQFFDKFDKKTIRFIKTRHYAVLAFASIRTKKIFDFVIFSAKALFTDPFVCLKIFFKG